MKVWKVILAAVVLFLTGALAGGAAARLIQGHPTNPRTQAAPLPWAAQRGELLRLMQRELSLTREQDAEARRLLEESRDRMNREWKKETQRVREEVARILTPEQRRLLAEIQRKRANRRMENPPRDELRRTEPRRFRNQPVQDPNPAPASAPPGAHPERDR